MHRKAESGLPLPSFLPRWALAVLAAVALCPTILAAQQAVDLQPGVQYSGGTRLQAAAYGISFTLPEGWVGALPPDSEFFVMQSAGRQAFVLAGIEELPLSQAQQLMADDIDLGDGVVMRPSGAVVSEGARLMADYAVTGAPEPLVGQVTTIIGDHGFGVFFVVASVAGDFEAARSAVQAVAGSVALVAPETVSAPAAGSWQEQLAGRKLSYFYTRTGYTEEDYIWLCADGRFFRSASSGGFGGGASGAFQSQYGGRWQASGDAGTGTLTLAYNDGSAASFTLSIEEEKLFLNGSRYFREVSDCR